MRSILFATDLSESSLSAFPFAVDLVKKAGAKLSLLHVYELPVIEEPVDPIIGEGFEPEDVRDPVSRHELDVREERMEKLKKLVADAGLEQHPHRCYIREGDIDSEIIDIAEQENADLIVMGTRGLNVKKKLFYGNTTISVIRKSQVPVLAIPPLTKFKQVEKIVYATELKEKGDSVLRSLVNLASIYQTNLTLLNICDNKDQLSGHRQQLVNMVEDLQYPKVAYNIIEADNAFEGIETYLRSKPADMLALTTHTTSFLDILFHRSLVKEEVMHSNIPLLVFTRFDLDAVIF